MDISVINYGREAFPLIEERFHAGLPVVLPNPTPLPYMVVATSATVVNRTKGRPPDQPVALFIGDVAQVAPYLMLGQGGFDRMKTCLLREKMTVLCPIRKNLSLPTSLAPSVQDDYMLLFAAHLGAIKQISLQFPQLYVSSGNVTGLKPKQRCGDIYNQFRDVGASDTPLLIVDGDPLRDQSQRHGSTTMVKISPTAQISVVREGIQSLNEVPST